MNVYFLVEGKRTEFKLYPMWLSHLTPKLQRVKNANEITNNNYYIFSGQGWPSILKHLETSICEINEVKNYDYLVICLDSEEETVEQRVNEIKQYLNKNKIKIKAHTQLKIIVQHRCIETWLLGNNKALSSNSSNPDLLEYIQHYDISKHDPEKMPILPKYNEHAAFHLNYLKTMLAEHKVSYSKKGIKDVGEKHYLDSLIDRNKASKHIQSFGEFIAFCKDINNESS